MIYFIVTAHLVITLLGANVKSTILDTDELITEEVTEEEQR